MKYITIFHANLNYAYLTPDKYEFVIRTAYEMIIDTMREKFPDVKYVFEASGYTIKEIAERTPDVLEKLKVAIACGQCEFMGSPYAHPMLPNFPQEDGLWTIRFSNQAYQKYLGMQPVSFWNPECGWRGYVPRQVIDAGYTNMVGDFEAYSRSCDSNGRPLRPEIYEKEFSAEKHFYNFGFRYDLPGDEKAIHFPFSKVAGCRPNELKILLRSDRIAQFGVRYFMGMDGYSHEDYLAIIKKFSMQKRAESQGVLIIFADDAEYVGTNGWFRLKYRNQPDNVFEATPDARSKLIRLIEDVRQLGEFTTFDKACKNTVPLMDTITFDDDSAWHGAKASTWAGTPMARILRPWQEMVRSKLLESIDHMDQDEQAQAWYYLTNSYNSDGQWPPTLPESPHVVHPFNYAYCFENLLKAEMLVGGVDRSKLNTNIIATMKEILSPQQSIIAEKARLLIKSGDPLQQKNGAIALKWIEKSSDYTSIAISVSPILYPSEYTIRVESLVEARRLVGGVEIEQL